MSPSSLPPSPQKSLPGTLDSDGFASDVIDHGWVPDILGDGFEQRTLPLGTDDEGPVVCTLVRSLPSRARLTQLADDNRSLAGFDVLYVHGWSDYFFNPTLAKFFTDRGANFYALDLRKYGRSLRRWQTPGYIEDFETYDRDIAVALQAMDRPVPKKPKAGVEPHDLPCQPRAGTKPLLLVGHSTGGLTLSLWANRYPGAAQGLLLNSPWLEFQLSDIGRHAVSPLINLGAKLIPKEALPQIDMGFYTRAQREVADSQDPMTINETWRPELTHAVHSGWLQAVFAGQGEVSAGLRIECPVGVMLSRKFGIPAKWDSELTRADSVLDVETIARDALNLGPYVSIIRIDGALHDVFLSETHVRHVAYLRMEQWLVGWRATLELAEAVARADYAPAPIESAETTEPTDSAETSAPTEQEA